MCTKQGCLVIIEYVLGWSKVNQSIQFNHSKLNQNYPTYIIKINEIQDTLFDLHFITSLILDFVTDLGVTILTLQIHYAPRVQHH